jgi:hypothetical protein
MKIMTSQIKQRCSNLLQHKESAVTTIINKMEGPSTLLTFLSDAITWVASYDGIDAENKNEAIYFLTVWINEIVHPWAFDKTDNTENILGTGIDNLFDYTDYKDYEKRTAHILSAFAYSLTQGRPNIILYQDYMEGISMLMEVSFNLYYFELARAEQMKAA